MRKLLAAWFATAMLAFTAADASEIKIVASRTAKDVLLELIPSFEQATGHRITVVWDSSAGGERRVLDGEAIDLIMIASPNIDRLIAAGKVVGGSSMPFVKSGVGIALKLGLPKPDVSTPDAVRKAVLQAKSVAYSQGPSGLHVADILKKFGIADQIKDKLLLGPPGVPIGEMLARGEADLGFQQVGELRQVSGIQYLGPLPAEIQHYTVFSFGLLANSASPEAAKAFVNFVRSENAVPVIKSKGLEPG